MAMFRRMLVLGVLCSAAVSCGRDSTQGLTGPTASLDPAVESGSSGSVTAQNATPVMVLRTHPEIVNGRIDTTGLVTFNLCNSSDQDQNPDNPEQGDTLNWQFHFGDSGTSAFNPDGTFNADLGHVCRTEHTYARGRYIATVSVTDQHLEDQGAEVSALARVTRAVTIVSSGGEQGSDVVTGALTTLFASNNSQCGNMFDVTPKRGLTITGFDVNLDPGSYTLEVYYRRGSSVGNESSSAGWTLAGSSSVVSTGADTPTSLNVGSFKYSD